MQTKKNWIQRGLWVAVLGWCAMLPTPAAQFNLLHTFAPGEGMWPSGELTLSGTTLYGMTPYGGVSNVFGLIFKMNADGSSYTNLHGFVGGAGDGRFPQGTLTQSGTTLYGLTEFGGVSNFGVVFQIRTDGSGYTNLHTFIGYPGDGQWPQSSLTLSGTNLFGTTQNGGTNDLGVIFRVNIDGSGYTNLHTFVGVPGDGRAPQGPLTLSGTTLYGMTMNGGVDDLGMIFRVNVDGSGYTNLHSFAGGPGDGADPYGALTLSSSTIYGMTHFSAVSNFGMIFKMNADGSSFTNLHSFVGAPGDGQNPNGTLTLSGTTLYGMTLYGGASNTGVLFQVQTDGSGYTNLHSFVGGAGDGAYPEGSLTLSGTTLYGMAAYGGSNNRGVAFALSLMAPAQLFFQHGGGLVARLLGATGAWKLRTAGDIDGDGVSDLLFQDTEGNTAGWLLNADGSIRSVIKWGQVGAWKLCVCADYVGEGHAQIFFQHPNGPVAFWHIDTNGVFQGAELVLPNAGPWHLRAAIPHAAGGRADLYWQTDTGLVAVWQQQSGGGITAQFIGSTGWPLCGAVDMDGDGVGDLLLQTADDKVGGWFMNSNGTVRAASYWWTTAGWSLKAAGR